MEIFKQFFNFRQFLHVVYKNSIYRSVTMETPKITG